MIDATKLNLSTKIVRALGVGEKFLYVPTGLGSRFKPVEGAQYYATLTTGQTREIVLVTGASGDQLFITRAMDHTVEQAFPSGACLVVEWNPAQLCEFVQSCTTGFTPVIDPGTYCLECTTCIEVDAAGRIVAINGVKKC